MVREDGGRGGGKRVDGRMEKVGKGKRERREDGRMEEVGKGRGG